MSRCERNPASRHLLPTKKTTPLPLPHDCSTTPPSPARQVVDFFRTVNKDAHLLTRMGSDGVQGCGGLVVRVFASCLRRLGLGNPGASVENMAFGTENPLDFSTKPGARGRSATGGGGGGDGDGADRGSGAPAFLSGEFVIEEEEELEEEDDADEEELSAQVCSWLLCNVRLSCVLYMVGWGFARAKTIVEVWRLLFWYLCVS